MKNGDGEPCSPHLPTDKYQLSKYLGLNVGGTNCSAVVGTGEGEFLLRREWPSRATRGAEPMMDELIEVSTSMMKEHPRIHGIGVSIGGPLDAWTGIVYSPPNLPGWDGIPLRSILESRLDRPARVDHDAAACALAEVTWGAGRDAERLVYLTCGTGFGAGLVIDGQPYYGRNGMSPEIGHIRYLDDGPEAFGKRGCFEAMASGTSLSRLAGWKFPERWKNRPSSPAEVGCLAREGDADAGEVLAINATAVGDACALVADLLAPNVIVLGSLAQYLGGPWIEQVRTRFREQALASVYEGCALVSPGLGNRLQDCSALAAAMLCAHRRH